MNCIKRCQADQVNKLLQPFWHEKILNVSKFSERFFFEVLRGGGKLNLLLLFVVPDFA